MEGTSKEAEVGSAAQTEEYYEVEKIISKRVSKGKRQYLVRWAGWAPSFDSWESEEDVDCPELISKYEEKQRRRAGAEERARQEPKMKTLFSPGEPTGFDEGLEAEAITGVTKIGNEIIYFVKWKNETQQGIIPGHIAKEKCPRLIIQYMENNIRRNDQHSN